MSLSLIAFVIFALTGIGLSVWLRQKASTELAPQVPQRNAEQLGKLHWREFAKLLLQAMHARGYKPVNEDGLPADGIPTDGSDMLLERHDERTLLSCKYGTLAVVDSSALLVLPQSAKLRGAEHILVVTPGRFEDSAVKFAREQNIELIDGETLWPEVRPYVPQPDAPIPPPVAQTPAVPHKSLAVAWLGAAVAGLLVWGIGMMGTPADSTPNDMPPPAPQVAQQQVAQKQAAQKVEVAAAAAAVPSDAAELETRRRETANAISTLFGVSRALWSTQSTLLVYLSSETTDPISDICPLLERYPELASSRIQLQPPAGSQKPVRFKQCRTY
ncbi:MAG: restriction endonuclease [Thermomonas sp.]|uniref:restriction endonuclease n=1 Tax=Thermomonas sp. TaxID=1971895 RepID=UPI001ED3B794|nr:restriction endonuclease [Thermomonas sp.]MBV2208166.1 restriction endonuclease [Thermomonas sp.]